VSALAAILPLGLAIGLVMGVLGAGGSILSVPALVYLLGEDPTTATTTSLVIVAVASLAGMVAHARAGRVRWKDGVIVGLLGIAGSWLGSHVAVGLDPQVLLLGFAVLLLGAAWAMLARRPGAEEPLRPTLPADLPPAPASPAPADPTLPAERGVVRPKRPDSPNNPAFDEGDAVSGDAGSGDARSTDAGAETVEAETSEARVVAAAVGFGAARLILASVARLAVGASGVGLLTGLFGVGGGFVVVPMLVLLLDFPMTAAVGTSLLVIAINATTALVGRLSASPDLDWGVIVPFAASAVVGVLLGARLAGRLPALLITRAFAGILVALGLFVGASALRTLL